MRLLVATTNPGKIREFRELLGADRFKWDDLSAHREVPAPEETGHTFEENAALKAVYYATLLNTWAIADDSGLEVDALNGSPGVYSARWAEMNNAGKGDAANNALLLRQLEDVSDGRRAGRFVCSLALANPSGEVAMTARDTVEGTILRQARGSNGFGYDPLFFIVSEGHTTAELTSERKHQISHRGRALRALRGKIERSELFG